MLLVRLLPICLVFVAVVHAEDDFDDDDDELNDMDRASDIESATVTDGDDFDEQEDKPSAPRVRPVYSPPVAEGNAYFTDAFISESDFNKRWVKSKSKKDGVDDSVSKYDGHWSIEEPTDNPLLNDLGLVLTSRAKHHAVAALLDKPFEFSGKPFIVQYEVRFQNGQDCGGAYIKLLSKDSKLDLNNFNDKTPYTIMFGPDKCGNDHKLHFIFRHKHPSKGTYEEKHAKKPSATLDSFFTDKKTHLYTLVVKPDNNFEIYVDQKLVNSGSLLSDVSPSVNPPKEISDPNDKKPDDWDDRERIPDPDATKPDDWDEDAPAEIEDVAATKPEGWLDDEPELIPDSSAEKPSDWDDDTDGEWEPPMINNPKCESSPGCGEWKRPKISNPNYKGKWIRPTIDNPNYKGKWTARVIPNPDYFEDLEPYKMTPIAAVGLELWSMSDGILFDNFIVTDDKAVADRWAADSWLLKLSEEQASSGGLIQSVIDATHERPWLWAVIIVVVILPLVLIVVYCCLPGGAKDDEAARRKKTDEPAPDSDAGQDGEDADESEETGVDEDVGEEPPQLVETTKSAKKLTKTDLEVKESDANAESDNVGDAESGEQDSHSDAPPQAMGDAAGK